MLRLCGAPTRIIDTEEKDGALVPTGQSTDCEDRCALAFLEMATERQIKCLYMTPKRWGTFTVIAAILTIISFLFAFDII